jgi:hypothetical protein
MPEKLGINPWLKIWVEPRETIRKIVKFDPKYRFYLLSLIYGFPMLLHLAQNLSLGQSFSAVSIVVGALILALFVGMLGIYIFSGLLFWTGKWIGGKGTFLEVRCAVTWSNVANVVNTLIWLILVAAFGSSAFFNTFTGTVFVGHELALVGGVFMVQLVVAVWAFIILLKTLGEVQGFSAWKALLNVVLPLFIITAAVWVLLWIVWMSSGVQ